MSELPASEPQFPAPAQTLLPVATPLPAPAPLPVIPPRRPPWWLIALIAGVAIAVGITTASVIFPLVSGAGAPGGWGAPRSEPVVYESPLDGYQVEFPAEPDETTQAQAVAGFDLEIVTASWTGPDRLVSVSSTEFPDELFTADAVDEQEFIEFDGERAISGLIHSSSAEVHMIVVFHNQTQYQVMSVNGTPEEHEAFTASFRFSD